MAESPSASEPPQGPPGGEPPRTSVFRGRRNLRSPGEALQPDVPPSPPTPPRKPRPLIATLSGVLSFLGIAAVALVVLVSLGIQRVNAPGPLPADKVVIIAPGTDVSDIVAQLEHEGVIDSASLMTATLFAEGQHSKLKVGEYLFKQSASLGEVIDTLVSGKQILHAITLPEGLTSEQICDRLKADDILVGEIRSVPKEGTLMPDTYKFARGTTRERLVRTMQQEQKHIVDEVWSHRAPDTPIKSPYEMLTLASIVEKETGKADERPRVAGVFVNRLVKGIPLQSDPTIVYGLVGGKGTLGRGILKSELEQKTPYNTYSISGLPPGPICNPGRAAMEAVANPSRTKDIYFVADGTGGHAFAETLDQHRQNVQRWRLMEKDAKDKVVPDADKMIQTNPASTPVKNQRGDAAPTVPIYGALRGRFEAAAAGPPNSALMLAVKQPPISFATTDTAAARFAPLATDPSAALDPDADGDAPVFPVGVPSMAEANARELPQPKGTELSFPVSAAQRAEEKARAAQFGLPAGASYAPPAAEVVSAVEGAPVASGKSPPVKGRIVDASEGTKLDPLLDKTYDLNTPKTVPVLKMPGTPAPAPR